jgi:hypothetical protein
MIPDRKKHSEKVQCNCDKCNAPSDFAIQYTETGSSDMSPTYAPWVQPDVVRQHNSRLMPPTNPVADPIPVHNPGAPEVVPAPENRIDPFKDDPTTRSLRTIPARPAGYLRSKTEVHTDPQASNQKSMRSILMSKAASKSISDSAHGLATTTSTRRLKQLVTNESQQVENVILEQGAPEVVPASLSQPMSSLRDSTTGPVEQYINPLRAR